MMGVCSRFATVVAVLCAPVLLCPRALEGQVTAPRIQGMELGSKDLLDRLDRPFWEALAAEPCRIGASDVVRMRPGDRVDSLRSYLAKVANVPKEHGGAVVSRSTVYRDRDYVVDEMLVRHRLPGAAALAFVARPLNMRRKSPAVILLHGSGMHPQEAFGWTLTNAYQNGERAADASFIGLASELARDGYTVYVPWLGDDALSPFWQRFHWSGLERNGAALGARVKWLGPMHYVVAEILGGVDYVESLPEVDASRIGVIGWGEGSDLAGFVAALDPRVRSVVKLSPPVNRPALRGTVKGVFDGAHFTHVDCVLGDVEIAQMLAPLPLLYAYSTKDESVSRITDFISLPVVTRIKQLYADARRSGNFSVQADTSWGTANRSALRSWLDRSMQFAPPPPSNSPPGQAPQVSYTTALIDSARAYRQRYVSGLGTCVSDWPHADFTSPEKFAASVQPFRQKIAADLGVPDIARPGRVAIVGRSLVEKRREYTIEFVTIQSSRTSMQISGLLATPNYRSGRMPAFVSADGDAGVGTPFALQGRERTPYLNAYGDNLAASGAVVFVPYYPFEFPEIAAAETRARPGGTSTALGYTLTWFSAAADFLSTLPGVDNSRIGIWGVSYAGVAALYAAALDTRFTTLVFSDPIVTADVLFGTQTSASLVSWWPEVCATVDPVQAYLIAPRRFVRENGMRDANGFERTPLESIRKIRETYEALGAGEQFDLVRHTGGHETRPIEVRRALR